MPPYDLINLKYFLFMMAVGVALSLLVMLARGAREYSFSFRKRSEEELQHSLHEFGGEVSETDRPVPLIIWVIATGVLVWSIGYVVFCGVFGM